LTSSFRPHYGPWG